MIESMQATHIYHLCSVQISGAAQISTSVCVKCQKLRTGITLKCKNRTQAPARFGPDELSEEGFVRVGIRGPAVANPVPDRGPVCGTIVKKEKSKSEKEKKKEERKKPERAR